MRMFSKKNIISLGIISLGIGCMIWALIQIQAQSQLTSALSTVVAQPISAEVDLSPVTLSPSPASSVLSSTTQAKSAMNENKVKILYPIRPAIGDHIGDLIIPAIQQKMPIIHGADEDQLSRGVGHFAQSVLPGEKNNSVLSGHRDSVFRQLGKLKIGDEFIIQTSAGIFTYAITKTRIVHKDDKTVIVPTDRAILTVTTCYPFNFIGDAPDRYILTAELMKSEKNLSHS